MEFSSLGQVSPILSFLYTQVKIFCYVYFQEYVVFESEKLKYLVSQIGIHNLDLGQQKGQQNRHDETDREKEK